MKSLNILLLFLIVIQISCSLNSDETVEKEDCSSLRVLNNKLIRQIQALQKKIANLTQENKELI